MPDVKTLTFIGQTYVPTISFDSEAKFQQAIPGTPADRFATTFQGRFVVQNAGAYTFCTASDDGSDLTIDGLVVVDNGGLHGTERRYSTVLACLCSQVNEPVIRQFKVPSLIVSSGVGGRCTTSQMGAGMHDASVNFFENDGAAVCIVTWSGADTKNIEVDPNHLTPKSPRLVQQS